MKKRYLVLALIVLMFCMSVVSASENVSLSKDCLGIDKCDSLSQDSDVNVLANESDIPDANDSSNNSAEDESSDTAGTGNNSTEKGSNTTKNSTNSSTNSDTVVKPKPKTVKTKNISTTYGTKVKYTVTVLDKDKKPIAGQKVTIKIGKQSASKNTSSKGIATFTLNFNAGNHIIYYYVGDLKGTNTFKVKNKVTFTILKWGLKGDVSKVKLIKKNMPNNAWVKKAVAATKKGLPLLKFEGGKGKIVFITAGVHGNELSSQVAAMKMIKHLTDTPIKGTVYIIPFVNVKAISKKVRHTGKDFNRIASKSGTISNKIVKLVVKYKCDAYGDFHTTQPGGIPGKNIVMGSKGPATQSAALTKYIAKNCNVNKKIYKYAGQQYPGALADNVNKNGIPAVICEVMLPHNTLTTKTINTSFNMMKYLLKFNSVI